MKKFYSPFFLISIFSLFIFCTNGNTQITILEDAELTELSMTASVTGTTNRSSLAYNPLKQLYYSVNAGSGNYYVDTYDADGVLLDSVVSGFDFRGAWWNPLLFTFEGNGYSSAGIFSKAIDPFTGVAIAGGSIVATNTQPDIQSVGDLDTARYEIIYQFGGSIYRYSRLDDSSLGTTVITGLPAGTVLNNYAVFYTGFEGMEFGVYDHANLRFVFVNKASEYVGYSQLPATAYPATMVNVSWANRLFWIFNPDDRIWYSYKVHDGSFVGIGDRELDASGTFKIFPNPVTSETQLDFENLNSEVSYIRILSVNGEVIKEITEISSTKISLDLQDEPAGVYILQLTTMEGDTHSKKLVKQ